MEVYGLNLSDVLIQKEKELQDLSKLRLQQLEDQVRQKNNQIDELNQKIEKIQDDFNFNLTLIDERDKELVDYESKFSNIKKLLKEKTIELSELKANSADCEQKFKNELAKSKMQEKLLTEARDELRQQFNDIK